MYIRLRTDHSLLESTLNIEKAIQAGREANASFFAVCERGHFASIAQAYATASQYDIRFVAAIELTLKIGQDTLPVIAVCKDEVGYRTLLKYHHQFSQPLDGEYFQMLASAHIIWVPVLRISHLERVSYIRQFISFEYVGLEFAERLQVFEIEQVKQIETAHQVKCCVMNAIVMKDEKEHKTLAVLQAIKTNSREISGTTTLTNTYLSRDRLSVLVDGYPELLTRIDEIVEKTHFTLEHSQKLPHYPFLDGEKSDSFLRKLVTKGAIRRYSVMRDDVKSRIEKELQVIGELGFADYFLILWDAKRYAFQNDILFGPGRGSSVGSIVAYCLGITEIDPLHHGLVFERFLNPGRKSYPDIDIDVADDKRDALIQYVKQRYGLEKVAHILTYGTFGAKSAFREVARIHGLSQAKIGEVTRHIAQSTPLITSYQTSKQLQLLLSRDGQLLQCYRIALQIEGLKRNTSTHAAGIIITDVPLFQLLPVFEENGYTSAWEMKELESSGFLKIDFLGLKNLSILDKLEQIVNEEDATFQMSEIPLDDVKTYQYLSLGLTNGIFQLESSGIKGVLRDLKPTQFEDIVAVLALYRPGPMESIPQFIARKYGQEKIEMPHPDLIPILTETYGVIVYQEQIMQIVHVMAHFDFAKADDFRRAISKKDETLLKTSLDTFEHASRQNGYAPDVVKQVSDLMLQFANYGFVKGHAVAYALIAYRLMYFKTHYSKHFYTVLLNHHIQDTMKITVYAQEMKRRQIMLLPPDIVLSTEVFKAEKSGIRMGLCSIKGIGKQTATQIMKIVMSSVETTAVGMIQSLLKHGVTKEHVEALILTGTFNRFQVTRQTLLHYVQGQDRTQGGYPHLAGLVNMEQEIKHYPEFSLKECEQFERDYLGYPYFQNVFTAFEQSYEKGILLPLRTLLQQNRNVHQTVARIASIRKHRNGQTQFVQIEDNTGSISAVVFEPEILQNIAITFGEIYHLHIKCTLYKGKTSYQIIKIAPIVS